LNSDDGKFQAAKSVARNIVKEFGVQIGPIEVRIESEIPEGSGLGSSAAVSVACAAAMTKFYGAKLKPESLSKFAMAGEKQVHGNPSGIDIEASLRGGLILFNRKTGAKQIRIRKPIQLLVIFSGKTRSTSRLVSEVARRRERYPNFFHLLAESASFQSEEVVKAAIKGDLPRLGSLFNIAQAELDWIGVSNPHLDRLIESVSGRDTFGAKITGAGGGGSIIALTKPDSSEGLLKSAIAGNPYSFITEIPKVGLRWEE
jgi:mevalonate kinase